MKKLLMILLISFLGAFYFIESYAIQASRNYQDETGFYVIDFDFDNSYYLVPATNPPGQPHYQATITVYQIVDGKKIIIGESFDGQYTEKGCFEDDPKYLIDKARKNQLGR
jgi:hypothetical protein